MEVFDAIVLGVVQGITEFLPISSSGHLILVRDLLGIETEHGLAMDAVLQLVTALAVALYFRVDIARLSVDAWRLVRGASVPAGSRVMLGALVIGTVPAVVAGLLLEDMMDTIFRDPALVAWVLIAGSGLFVLAEWVHARRRLSPSVETGPSDVSTALTFRKAFAIGCFQALALVPGMSRSGATISGGMLLGLTREHAARFAFLLMIPIVFGAGSKKLLELGGAGMAESEWHMLALASLAAFMSGIASIHYLLRFLRHHSLFVFVAYRLLLACAVLYVLH